MSDTITFGNGEWLTCSTCHHPLVPLSVVQGKSVLIMGQVVVYRAAVVCGKCGTPRDFRSKPVEDLGGGAQDKPTFDPVAGPVKW